MVEQTIGLLDAISKFAWPTVALVALIMFRRTIAERLAQVRTLKAPGGTELSFAERAESLLVHAGQVAGDQELTVDVHQQILLNSLHAEDPRAAMTQAFHMVRNALIRAVSVHDLPEGHTSLERVNTLLEKGLLKQDAASTWAARATWDRVRAPPPIARRYRQRASDQLITPARQLMEARRPVRGSRPRAPQAAAGWRLGGDGWRRRPAAGHR